LAQLTQSIELLVEKLSPPADAGFSNLLQPLGAMTRSVDLLPPTQNPQLRYRAFTLFMGDLSVVVRQLKEERERLKK
jgi:hypothetical protein